MESINYIHSCMLFSFSIFSSPHPDKLLLTMLFNVVNTECNKTISCMRSDNHMCQNHRCKSHGALSKLVSIHEDLWELLNKLNKLFWIGKAVFINYVMHLGWAGGFKENLTPDTRQRGLNMKGKEYKRSLIGLRDFCILKETCQWFSCEKFSI